MYLYAPFKALPNKLDECKLLFNHINNFSTWGAITCDDEKGTIRWRHSAFESTDPSVTAIDSAFRVGGDIFKHWFDQISSVALTKTTAQAIIDHSKIAPEPEGVESFDKHISAQEYQSPLKSLLVNSITKSLISSTLIITIGNLYSSDYLSCKTCNVLYYFAKGRISFYFVAVEFAVVEGLFAVVIDTISAKL